MSFVFRPAASITDTHGIFVALEAPTNAGKTVSGLRLARGLAGPGKEIAVIDTEGGRTLHLRDKYPFHVLMMDPPHRPERYLEAARSAQEAGFGALLIDSFTSAWRGIGGVLDWTDSELEAIVERQRARAAEQGWQFNESLTRDKNKLSASIKPKMAWKLMVSGFLALRMPVIFAIRGENTMDPNTKKEVFKAQMQRDFRFEVTVSFRLAAEKKGVIDLSDPKAWKMEGAHRDIFRDGDQLSEEHGAKLAAWARGQSISEVSVPAVNPGWPILAPDGRLVEVPAGKWLAAVTRAVGNLENPAAIRAWRREMGPHLGSIAEQGADASAAVRRAEEIIAVAATTEEDVPHG